MANQDAIKRQMQQNSEAWHTADAATKKTLEAANKELGSSLGASYDSKSGSWSSGGGEKLYEVNVPTKNTSTAKTPTRSSIPAVKNVVPTNNTPINLSSDMSYKDADKAFTQKYQSIINKIADYNNADSFVGREMLTSNLDSNASIYKGGGEVDNWDEMVNDWKMLKGLAQNDVQNSGRSVTDASGRSVKVSDLYNSLQAGDTSYSGANMNGMQMGGQAMQNPLQGIGGFQEGQGYQYGGDQLGQLADMYQQNSDSFFDGQKAQFDKLLSQQITDLKKSYEDAIAQGQISVRDAEAQFNQQKAEIEKAAYQQSQSTKLLSSDLGISNSMQSVGLQQADNSRINSANNSNLTERDRRVNDTKDRINALTVQKDLSLNQARNDYGYNMAGASAQASQMYNQNMSGLMQQDYFSNKEQYNTERNREADFQNTLIGYDKQAQLDIEKMFVGRDIDLEMMDKQLMNQFATIDKQYGIDSKLNSQKHNQAMSQISKSAQAQAKAEVDAYQIAMSRKIDELGLPKNSTAYDIDQKLRQLGREEFAEQAKLKLKAEVESIEVKSFIEYENSVLMNPNISNQTAPFDYTKNTNWRTDPISRLIGQGLNWTTDYNTSKANWEQQQQTIKDGEAKLEAIKAKADSYRK